MKLTEHFSLEEFINSETAKKNKVNNIPGAQETENIRMLCEKVLEPARIILGQPITISSGYRCQVLNHLVGGVRNSQHITGQAADLQCKDLRKLFDIIKEMGGFDQLLFEKSKNATWVHVSYNKNGNRGYANDNYKV